MRNTNQRVPIAEYEYLLNNNLNPLDYLTEHEVRNNTILRKLFYTQHTEYPDDHIETIEGLILQ